MLVLGVETSERRGVIALSRDDECLEECVLSEAGRRHAQTLVSEAAALLLRHGCTPRQLELVAVGVGPGSFTGLRVGVVFAKTLAYASGCALAGVETFRCIAEATPADVDRVLIASEAQRGELFVQEFVRDENSLWSPVARLELSEKATWCQARTEGDVVSGPVPADLEEDISSRCRLLDDSLRHPQARNVCVLGSRQFRAGDCADLWNLEPLYFRKSAAEEKWEAKQ